jgi:hypothetical protein
MAATSEIGTNRTNRVGLTMSALRGNPEVAGRGPKCRMTHTDIGVTSIESFRSHLSLAGGLRTAVVRDVQSSSGQGQVRCRKLSR